MALTHPSVAINTSFSGKDISSAASVYQYTAAASGIVAITVRITDAAGNGDYVVYLSHQWLGAGDAAIVLPKSTCAAASGETDIEFATIMFYIASTDVVDVMIEGQAGDTSVSGDIRIVIDNPSVFEATDPVTLAASQPNYTPAVAGDEMDLVNAPNATALAAIVAAMENVSVADILAMAYEGSETFQEFLRLARAVLLGKSSGGGAIYRDAADSKARVTASLDSSGNRTSVSVDAS